MKPKPGDSSETGAERLGGWPWGPDEADGWPWRPSGRTAGPEGSAPTPRTCCGVPAGDYKPRAALEGTLFFGAKTDMARKLTYFLFLLQLAKWLCPFKLYRNSVQGGMVDAKSYFTNAKTHHDEASQMTDLSPDLTTCDTERRTPPLWLAPPGMK